MADPGFQKEGGALMDNFENNVFTLKKLNLGQKGRGSRPSAPSKSATGRHFQKGRVYDALQRRTLEAGVPENKYII